MNTINKGESMMKFITLFFISSFLSFSQTATAPAGSGTSGDPYQVSTINNLYWISQNSSEWVSGKYFIQTTDIDASETSSWSGGAGWVPIGNSTDKFYGSYDGQGFNISNLYMTYNSTFGGFFGYITSATITDVNLVDIDFTNTAGYVGGIIAQMNAGIISGCTVTGNITGSSYSSGIAASITGTATIEKCGFSGNVTTSSIIAGGIVGTSGSTTDIISECWSTGSVYGASTSSNYLGGIVGYNKAVVQNCYSTMKLTKTGSSSSYMGGVVGYAHNSSNPTITNCYSTGPLKPVIGYGTATVTACFWDKETSSITSSSFGTGKMTSEMKTTSTFSGAGWDFSTIWARSDDKNGGYPYLQVQSFSNTSALTSGSAYSPTVTKGLTNQPLGRFALNSAGSGCIFDYIWIRLNGTRSGAYNFKLWSSSDDVFDSGSDTQIGSSFSSDPGDGSPLWFTALNQTLTVSDKYYFLTCDLSSGATGNIQAEIVSDKDLMFCDGVISSAISGVQLSTDPIPLPVELTSFTATAIGSAVKLNWKTSTEVNNYGFDIEQAVISNEERNLNWNKIGFVNGNGNSNSPKNYSFVDDEVSTGNYSYRLKQIDNDGQFEYSKVVDVSFMVPTEFSLEQNYPNPFNPTTKIRYNIPDVGTSFMKFIQLKVYDVLGNEVETLVNENKPAGKYEVEFDGSGIATGIYYYKLSVGDFVQTKKMMLIK